MYMYLVVKIKLVFDGTGLKVQFIQVLHNFLLCLLIRIANYKQYTQHNNYNCLSYDVAIIQWITSCHK